MAPLRWLHSKALNLSANAAYALRGTTRRRRELERAERLPRAELECLVMGKARKLLAHAFENVPHYRQIAAERSLAPEDFETYEDLAKLPILTKKEIQENRGALVAEQGPSRDVRANHTGGSTGEPLTFFQDREYREWSWADKARFYEMCGYRFGDPFVFLWGADWDAAEHRTALQRWLDSVGRNLLWVNTFDLSENALARYAEEIAAHSPALIVGYVSSLTLYARYLLSRGGPVPQPRAIQSSAEVLTEGDRTLLEDTFSCPVFDRYGCREMGAVAHECEVHAGLHVSMLNNIVEIVGPNGLPAGPGEMGRIIVTNLNDYAMPFIRYDVGDLGTLRTEPCDCGRTTRRLTRIAGRTSDIIVTPSGKLLHGEFFTRLFYGREGVKQFQVIQEAEDRLRIRLVLEAGYETQDVSPDITRLIRTHADERLSVDIQVCDRIPTTSSGKRRFVVSELDTPFAQS